jgi:hypothetical protein
MKKHLYFLVVIILLCACKGVNEPVYNPGAGTNTNTNQETKTPSVSFVTERVSPLMFKFTNTSYNCSSFRWDFGDGTYANGKDAYKSYETIGTYTVTLTGTAVDGKKYYSSEEIVITRPKIYVVGYTLYRIPYENRYYKLVVKDDNLFPSDWDWYTRYTPLLDNTDIPYSYEFVNPVQFVNPESHTYYTVQLIRTTNTSSTSNDVSCTKQKLYVKDLLKYEQEYILETDATAIGIKVDFEY